MHVRDLFPYVNGLNMPRTRKKIAQTSADHFIDGEDLATFDDDPIEFEQDRELFEAMETDLEPEAPKKVKRRKKADTEEPQEPKKMPVEPPFHILRKTPNRTGTGSRYMVIDTWTKKSPPTPIQLRDSFGPGSYQIQDALGAKQTWAVAEFKPNPIAASTEADDKADEPQSYAPTPQRLTPQLESPPQWQQPAHQHQAAANAYAQQNMPGHQVDPRLQYQQPMAPPAYAQPAPVDPQLMSTIYRLDAAIQQISADTRRLQDELRSVTYELQQVPTRVSERVAAAIADASDPFDQGVKILQMSREMASGITPGEDKDGGIADLIAGVAQSFASKAMGAQTQATPEHAPPPPAMPAPTPAITQAPPTNGSLPASDETNTLPGMTPEKAELIRAEAQKRGITFESAIAMAAAHGMNADMLIAAANATAPTAVAPS